MASCGSGRAAGGAARAILTQMPTPIYLAVTSVPGVVHALDPDTSPILPQTGITVSGITAPATVACGASAVATAAITAAFPSAPYLHLEQTREPVSVPGRQRLPYTIPARLKRN